MFTGLVQAVGGVHRAQTDGPGRRLDICESGVAGEAMVGASIAVNGCCLTVVELKDDRMSFEVGPETLSRTNLGELKAGDFVNLERSLQMGEPLGGHLVSGHVDAMGTLDERQDEQQWATMWFRLPSFLSGQIVSKGCIAVDGISLTLVDVEAERFSVQVIPHTLALTTLGEKRAGCHVNIETDLIAKYVEKQLSFLRNA
ncbi:MAG: riboflavin synthase [Planctomycetota bacterium]|nr:riboflavin synthase [Planctomycetota bacterium]